MSRDMVRATSPEETGGTPIAPIPEAALAAHPETHPDPNANPDPHGKPSSIVGLAIASIGVVYGDIGTSPLYALRESLAHTKNRHFGDEAVVGTVSLLLWALFFTVTAKYVLFLMRADNKGEGGTLSLMALAQKALGRRSTLVFFLGVAGAALFSGDAIITPAISVLSALEGLDLVSPFFDNPRLTQSLTILILVTLFFVQRTGTARVGVFFGPVMVVFFLVIAVLGAIHIGDSPRILAAFLPWHALGFLFGHGFVGFIVLGSVFLAVTGAEALYADMGHFGRLPIQAAWLVFVLPALCLNYLGQGALVLAHPETADNPFFKLAPAWLLLPLVILSTMATVIASQAVITGAYSLARQAIQLGLLPRMLIQHTSDTQEGQIFIPRINVMLLIGVLALVIIFQKSDALASAYGIAVTGTMVVTTAIAFVVVWKLWRWPLWLALLFAGTFLAVDLAFLAANLVKVLEGRVRAARHRRLRDGGDVDLGARQRASGAQDPARFDHHAGPHPHAGEVEAGPRLGHGDLPHQPSRHRALVADAQPQAQQGAARARGGDVDQDRADAARAAGEALRDRGAVGRFLEGRAALRLHGKPAHPSALGSLRKAGLKFDIMTTSFFLGRRTIKTSPNSGMPLWQDRLFVALSKQAANATDFFAIPSDRVVELGAQISV